MNNERESILMNLPEGIILLNKTTKDIPLCNKEFVRLFELPPID